MSQLICKNLLVGYEGKAILDPLNFEIHAGGYLCVVGENGAGKSTLMKTLLGLQQPISGQIEMGDGLRRNEIGYLPQQTIVQKADIRQTGASKDTFFECSFSFFTEKKGIECPTFVLSII